MKGHTEGENKIKSYLSLLDSYSDDPAVAELSVRVVRNLLLRARGFTETEVRDLLDRVSATASLHPSLVRIQASKFESFEIALLSTARDRKILAVSDYYAMLGMAKDDFWSGDKSARVLQAITVLLNNYSDYPAAAFRIWGQTVGSMPCAPITSDQVDEWATVAVQLARRLHRVDPVSAFSVWLEAVEWAKLPGTSQSVLAELVTEAYDLIQRKPDPALSLNDYLWNFVLGAETSRKEGEDGLLGRIYSALAATEMVRAMFWTERAQHDALVQRILDRGLATQLPGGKMRVNNDALMAEPDFAKDLEDLNARVAVFLDQAESWLNDDLVFTKQWVVFVNGLQDIQDSAPITMPSLRHLKNKALEMSEEARKRRAGAIREDLQIADPKSDWVDSPLVPTGWRDVRDEGEIRSLISLVSLPNAPMYGKTFAVERVRRRDLPFYKDLTLVEAQITSDLIPRGILTFLLLPMAQVSQLDGTARPVHQLNKSYLSGMDDPTTVLEYLYFFCNAVRGEQGPFRIVGKVMDIPFTVAPTAELRMTIERLLPVDGLDPTPDVGDNWRVKALINYSNRLFLSTLEIKRNGMVEMLADDALLADLNVATTKMLDGLRVLDDGPSPR